MALKLNVELDDSAILAALKGASHADLEKLIFDIDLSVSEKTFTVGVIRLLIESLQSEGLFVTPQEIGLDVE